jgi:hypothetical protein
LKVFLVLLKKLLDMGAVNSLIYASASGIETKILTTFSKDLRFDLYRLAL